MTFPIGDFLDLLCEVDADENVFVSVDRKIITRSFLEELRNENENFGSVTIDELLDFFEEMDK
ncbi:hypothetical protein predicted by Glimmer/Critica [Acetobacter senegalensis]|uniref:Uncharacterized protein n=1 Tax=Acetobacter senegalensis TaxID=446692 RepID=A0A0U4Y2F1_9PROT|nr:hypothetical protein [Acetobacter senegalensis]CEF41086.1 hypothetical protein predicted by Glimmer/Critica [Acetobacter senegalensis]